MKSYPIFAINDFPELVEILFTDGGKHAETWNGQNERWECHALDTMRTVETDAVLLYRLLPAGIGGDRLDNCPRLLEEISKQSKVVHRLLSKRQRGRNDENKDISTKRSRPISMAPIDPKDDDHVMWDNIPDNLPSLPTRHERPDIPRASQMHKPKLVKSLRFQVMPTLKANTHTAPDKSLKSRPLATKELSASGARLFPASFYAVDVFEGFEHMDVLMQQRRPRVYQQEAFTDVFGLPYIRSTYQKHCKIYDLNLDLVPKFNMLGQSSKGTWNKFRQDAMEVVDSDSEPYDSDVGDSGEAREGGQDNGRDGVGGGGQGVDDDGCDFEQEDEFSESESDNAQWASCCAYCDEPMPPQQSEKLLQLQIRLDSKSTLDGVNGHDASQNPHHRYIRPFTATVEYCAQHRFEGTVVPTAHLNTTWAAALPVDFGVLRHRVERLKSKLDLIVNAPFDNIFFRDLCQSTKGQGLSQALGSAGEYTSFKKTSAG